MDNKQKKPRFIISIFDIIIIAVIIIAAAALIYVWQSSGKSSNVTVNAKPVHYVIELNGMVAGSAGKIKPGDTIYDSQKKYVMGTVEYVTIGPATSPTKDLTTGDTLLSPVPGREMATIGLICDCSWTDAQITAVSGYAIRVGAEVHAAGPGYAGIGYLIAIDRGDVE